MSQKKLSKLTEEQQRLVEENINLVYGAINKYYPTFAFDEDIQQCGMIGLCNAARSYKKDKSKFSTYAVRCILNEIKDEFRIRMKYKDEVSYDAILEQLPR